MKELSIHAVAGTIDDGVIRVTAKNKAKINVQERITEKHKNEMKKETIKETKSIKDAGDEPII